MTLGEAIERARRLPSANKDRRIYPSQVVELLEDVYADHDEPCFWTGKLVNNSSKVETYVFKKACGGASICLPSIVAETHDGYCASCGHKVKTVYEEEQKIITRGTKAKKKGLRDA